MMRDALVAVLGLGTAMLVPFGAAASWHQTRAVEVAERCSRCGPALQHVAAVDGRTVPELVRQPRRIASGHGGSLLVWVGAGEPVEVFDSTGRYSGPLARVGSGPGEIDHVAWLDIAADGSIMVASPARVSLFDARHRFVKARALREPLTAISRLTVLADGNWITTPTVGEQHGPASWSFPIAVRDSTGRVLRRLELTPPEPRPRSHAIGAARGSARFWGVQQLPDNEKGYAISRFDQSGSSDRFLGRRPSWWMTQPPREPEPVRSAPMFVREVARGQLVILIAHPRPDWRDIRIGPGGGMHRRHEAVVDLIDPGSGRLIGSRPLAGWPLGILDDSRIATYREVDGYPIVDVWRIAW